MALPYDEMIASMSEQLAELYAEREKLTAAFGNLDADQLIAYVRQLQATTATAGTQEVTA